MRTAATWKKTGPKANWWFIGWVLTYLIINYTRILIIPLTLPLLIPLDRKDILYSGL